MDEIARSDPRRMNPPAFKDRHPVLNPQDRFFAIGLRKQEADPAGIAGMRREQFGQGGLCRLGQVPVPLRRQGSSPARPLSADARLGSCLRRSTVLNRPGARGDGSAGDQRQASCHTTHNAYVLLLFFFA